MNSGASRPPRPGFTVIELVFTIAVIFLLMGLLIAGVHHAIRGARGTVDRAAVTALKSGVQEFHRQFNIYVPLVKDGWPPLFPPPPASVGGPLNSTRTAPVVYSFTPTPTTNPDITVLQTAAPTLSQPLINQPLTDPRFSIYSLSYYLVGALEKPVDGVDGQGFCAVKRDGSFEKAGRKFSPFYDPRRGDAVHEETPPGEGRIRLRDSRGVAFRYYRWAGAFATMPNGPTTTPTNLDLRVPELVGDPEQNPELRNAEYAIVCAGLNGVFGDEDLLPAAHPQYLTFDDLAGKLGLSSADVLKVRRAAAADNIVEVGR